MYSRGEWAKEEPIRRWMPGRVEKEIYYFNYLTLHQMERTGLDRQQGWSTIE